MNIRGNRHRRAFTLVELLIVIIIIGILSGMMLLTMSEVRAKAEATRIVGELRTIKNAAILSFSDHGQSWGSNSQDIIDHINDYLDQDLVGTSGHTIPPRRYLINIGNTKHYYNSDNSFSVKKSWCVSIRFEVETSEIKLRDKLAGMAEEAGIYDDGYGCDSDRYFDGTSNKFLHYPLMYYYE